MLVNKHPAPCCGLHSFVARAIDVALDALPVEQWSDYMSLMDIVRFTHDFNARAASMFSCTEGTTVAADMVDCFHHVPCMQCMSIWASVAAYWEARGFKGVSVPSKSLGLKGRLGLCQDRGWTHIRFVDIARVLQHFVQTNFVALPGWVGRERHGVPMGDALSSVALRLFKWHRERIASADEGKRCLRFVGSKCQLWRLLDHNVLVLDISYRDDLRMYCAWDARANLSADVVQSWAWQRLLDRYSTGSMALEASDPLIFTALCTMWRNGLLTFHPCLPDPWAAAVYDILDNNPLKPWFSWGPPQQHVATLHGLLCRVVYLTTWPAARSDVFWQVFVALVFRAGFPVHFVITHATRWAKSWQPRRGAHAISELGSDVQLAVDRLTSCAVAR